MRVPKIPHAALGAYQYADLSKPCPNCGADAWAICTQRGDVPRHLPCITRLAKPENN
jgi:hypothetical protein